MPRRPPPEGNRFKPGQTKPPNSGRRAGGPNKVSVEARDLCYRLVHDARYHGELRRRMCGGRIHPTIEALIWAYAIGKPVEHVQVDAKLVATQKIDAEPERLRCLDVLTLERLLAESDAMIERALAEAEGKRQGVPGGREH